MSTGARSKWRAFLTLLVAFGLAMPVATGSAAQSQDPRAERERVRSQQASVAAQVDTLKATNAEVSQALAQLEANVADQQALLEDGQRAADQAATTVEQARGEEKQAVDEVASLQSKVRDVAVESYMRPTTADPGVILSSDSVTDAARRSALLDFRASKDADLLDQLRAGREDVALRREEAQQAALRAEQQRQELADRLVTVEQARAQQEQFSESVEQRLDATLAESASLQALDSQLADQIAADEARIAAQVRASRAREAQAASPAAPRPASRSANTAAPSITSAGPIVSVRGIRVSSQIASQLEGMLAAADADGVALSGSGYRDPAAQIAVRQSNCGTSDYAVYQMSASQCSPPTARPGTSMHERGLAIDFTYNGSLISSRSNPGYLWLAGNASRFGFYNLPSEPWHWSTTGS
ncbi:MAG: D-alanyl-D-alanine carboxypeptidase family protein [Acidimicrobiales bacterium]